MSLLKQQIQDYIGVKRGESSRNLRMLLSYLGLGNEIYCTEESLGKSNDITRNRVQQIFKENLLKDQRNKPTLSALLEIEQIIDQSLDEKGGYALFSDITTRLLEKGLIDETLHPFGLFNFPRYFNFCIRFTIINVEKTDEENYRKHNEFILARKQLENTLISEFQEILNQPGDEGKHAIYRLNSLFEIADNRLLKLDDAKKKFA